MREFRFQFVLLYLYNESIKQLGILLILNYYYNIYSFIKVYLFILLI